MQRSPPSRSYSVGPCRRGKQVMGFAAIVGTSLILVLGSAWWVLRR
jgi:hypothetical protein